MTTKEKNRSGGDENPPKKKKGVRETACIFQKKKMGGRKKRDEGEVSVGRKRIKKGPDLKQEGRCIGCLIVKPSSQIRWRKSQMLN